MADYILGSMVVESQHYDSRKVPASSISKKIEPSIMISGRIFTPPTVGSDGHFPGMNPFIYTKPNWQTVAKHITASNPHRWEVPISDFRKYGNFSPQIDDIGFASWKATGEESQAREYVVLPSKSILNGYIESFGERKLNLPKGDTPVDLFVHDNWYTGRINDYGKYSHLIGNLKQNLMEYYGLKSSQDLVEFLESKGQTLEDIGYLAIGFIPKGAVYAVDRARDGKVIFFGAKDSFDGIKDIRNFAFDEELTHIARKSYDLAKSIPEVIDEEIGTKSMVRDFYIKMAKGAEGNPELVRKYMKLAALKDDEVNNTREVYSELFKRHQRDLESIVEDEDGHEHHSEASHSTSTYSSTDKGKVIYMPKRTPSKSEKQDYDSGTAKVLYGKFDKSKYEGKKSDGTEKDADGKYLRARPSRTAEAQEASTAEASDGEPSAEAPSESAAEAA